MSAADHARLLLLAGLWSASFLLMRIASPVLGGMLTTTARVMIGVASLAVLLPLLGVRLSLGQHWRATLLLGVVNSGVPFLMYALAARVLPAGYSAILNATTPLMGIVIGAAFFAERIDMRKMLGVITGLLGVATLTAAGPIAMTAATAGGIAACLVATACYGASGFLTRRWITDRGGMDPKLVAFGSQIGASLLLAPFLVASLAESPLPLATALGSPRLLLALLALGAGCTAYGYILYFRLVADIGSVRSLAVTFLIPPFGVLWGALFLQEKVSWAHLWGAAWIAAALWLVLWPARRSSSGPDIAPRAPS